MLWSTSVLTSHTSDTQPTVLVSFENAKYIFNIGENTNRAVLQSRQNFKRARGIFLTGCDLNRSSGLTGCLMSLSDAAITSLTVAGPPGITHYLAGMRSFTFRESMTVTPLEASLTTDPDQPFYKDDNVQIFTAPVYPGHTGSSASQINQQEGLKRKLPEGFGEGELSAKRRHTVSSGDAEESSLAGLMKQRDFCPTTLEGDRATEYRNSIVSSMFGASAKRGKPSQRQEADSIDNYWQRPPLPGGFFKQLPPFTPPCAQPKQVYAVVGPRIRGKFDIKRAEALGVPFGPLRGKLTRGQAVTFKVQTKTVDEDGSEKVETEERTVQPEECVGETVVPGVVIVVDVPTREHVASLKGAFEAGIFKRFRSAEERDTKEYDVRVVYHLLGPGVLEDAAYVEFMSGFKDGVHHIVSSPEHSKDPVTFTSAASNQLKLHQLDPQVFPLPHFNLTAPRQLMDIPNLPTSVHLLESGLITKIKPTTPPTKDAEISHLDLFHPVAAPFLEKGIAPTLSEHRKKQFDIARKVVSQMSDEGEPKPGHDVDIFPLGTGSALPTKYRNVSGILLRVPKHGDILLDAGEGTWGQLMRRFGHEGVEDVLRNLHCIFISHIHADHHSGLAKILAMRRSLNLTQPLFLVAPRHVHLYLREWSDLEDLGINDDPSSMTGVKSIMSEALHSTKPTAYLKWGKWSPGGDESWVDIARSHSYAGEMRKALGLADFMTVDVEHRVKAYAAVIKHSDDWSVVYSGDTKPCNHLVQHGQGATLLIHEATMGDEEAEMAQEKAHSTVGQAMSIATRMRAENLLLTHFSARYPKMPPSLSSPSKDSAQSPIVGLAFDLAKVKIGEMKKLSVYVEAMKVCVDETNSEEGDDEGAEAAEAGLGALEE